ncbi:unnamed protein product [Urochloa humidicola]
MRNFQASSLPEQSILMIWVFLIGGFGNLKDLPSMMSKEHKYDHTLEVFSAGTFWGSLISLKGISVYILQYLPGYSNTSTILLYFDETRD